MNAKPMTNLDQALRLARKNKPVFPCWNTPDNPDKNKAPIPRNGFKDATTDEKQIRRWWGQHPDALIGLPTGRASNCTVVDIDSGKADSDDPKLRAEGEAAQQWWQENKAQYKSATIVVTQSGGLHVFCRFNGERNTQGGIHKGVDRRGEGGYVIFWAAHGCAVLQENPQSEWPVAPANADGTGELDLMRYGLNMATMQLWNGADGADAADQMGEVLENLIVNPDEYHKNLQRMAFILAMWFDQPLPRIRAFLEGITNAAARTGRIDARLHAKHMSRIARMAEWYASKAQIERHEKTMEMLGDHRATVTVKSIADATPKELDQLQRLIDKRRKALEGKSNA